MALLDLMVRRNFSDQKAGRVVVFPTDLRNRAYLVRSQAEELKITAFLKMYYTADLLVQLVSLLFIIWLIPKLTHVSHDSLAQLLGSVAFFLGIYALLVVIPYWLLWRACKRSSLCFVSAQDEVMVSDKGQGQKRPLLLVVIFAFAVLILLGIIFLVHAK